MSQKSTDPVPAGGFANKAKWILVFVLLAIGLGLNYYFYSVAWAIRVALGLVFFALLFGVSLTTEQGQLALEFLKGARIELRKVTWPTRQETVQSTVAVMVMVILTSIVLWGLDSILMMMVQWLTGQRG